MASAATAKWPSDSPYNHQVWDELRPHLYRLNRIAQNLVTHANIVPIAGEMNLGTSKLSFLRADISPICWHRLRALLLLKARANRCALPWPP